MAGHAAPGWMAGAARAGSPPAAGLRLARTCAPLRLRECGCLLERAELRPVLVRRVGRRSTRAPGRARPPSGSPARPREGCRRPRAACWRGLRRRRARHHRDRPAPTRRMTLIDAFLRECGGTFAVEGLDAGWSTVLVTPWWHASRHVVALVYSRRDGRMALVVEAAAQARRRGRNPQGGGVAAAPRAAVPQRCGTRSAGRRAHPLPRDLAPCRDRRVRRDARTAGGSTRCRAGRARERCSGAEPPANCIAPG